jgi:hypothetical protein
MRQPKGVPCHDCAPQGWRHVSNITGDYDMDATILHRSNPSLPDKLKQYTRKSGPVTNYTGYHNYHGDD